MHSSRAMIAWLGLCLALALAVFALPALGVGSVGAILLLALFALCPISMFFMMRRHQGRDEGPDRTPEERRWGR